MDRLVISATGHRPNKLGGYGDEVYHRLVKLAEQYINEIKPTDIISGMALGWDQAWAHAGINLGVRVHAAIPFLDKNHNGLKNLKSILNGCSINVQVRLLFRKVVIRHIKCRSEMNGW